jgi:serine/threonine protein phosphatase 1
MHGEFDQLKSLLEQANFNTDCDRLLSVGDIIDRGPQSPECLELLDQSWFFMVRGNHEQMLIEAVNEPALTSFWYNNGGLWSAIYPSVQIQKYATTLDSLPYIITIENVCHIAHAEITSQNGAFLIDDSFIYDWELQPNDEENLLWGRNVNVRMKVKSNMLPIYVGHTIYKEFTIIGNHHFIDQGACVTSHNSEYSLAMINPVTKEYFKYLR